MWKRSERGDPPLQLHCSPGSIDQTEQSPQSSPESAYREAAPKERHGIWPFEDSGLRLEHIPNQGALRGVELRVCW